MGHADINTLSSGAVDSISSRIWDRRMQTLDEQNAQHNHHQHNQHHQQHHHQQPTTPTSGQIVNNGYGSYTTYSNLGSDTRGGVSSSPAGVQSVSMSITRSGGGGVGGKSTPSSKLFGSSRFVVTMLFLWYHEW